MSKTYRADLRAFMDTGYCDPDGVLARRAEVDAIAGRHNKTFDQVSLDINRAYIGSWQRSTSRRFNLLDD